jgi:hypothetical protein
MKKEKRTNTSVIKDRQTPYQQDKRNILKFVPKLRKIKQGGR